MIPLNCFTELHANASSFAVAPLSCTCIVVFGVTDAVIRERTATSALFLVLLSKELLTKN